MIFDWTISLGNIFTVLTIFGGGLIWLLTFKSTVDHLGEKVGLIDDRIENVERKLERLVQIIATLAAYEEKFRGLDQRLRRTETDISEMRHGKGFILPDALRRD